MIKKFYINNIKYFYVGVTSDYSNVLRSKIDYSQFMDYVYKCLDLGLGVEHRTLCTNEFSSVEKDIFYLSEDKKICVEFMYTKEYFV